MSLPVVLLSVVLLSNMRPGLARAESETRAGAVVVRWDDDAGDAGRWVAQRWEGLLAEARRRLGVDPDLSGAEVLVVRGPERLRAAARVGAPEWAGGVTVAGQRVVVRVDGAQGEIVRLLATLRHEAVHLLWARHAGAAARRLPLWFEEGLAEEIGGAPSVLAGARLDVALGTGALLDFETLERLWPTDAYAADLAYQQARRWIGLLIDRQGWTVVPALLARVRADAEAGTPTQVLDRALRTVTGHPLSDWHADWRLALEERRDRWWLWFFVDLDGLVWTFIALVCAGSFFVLRRRRRRAIEALPDGALPEEGDLPPAPPQG